MSEIISGDLKASTEEELNEALASLQAHEGYLQAIGEPVYSPQRIKVIEKREEVQGILEGGCYSGGRYERRHAEEESPSSEESTETEESELAQPPTQSPTAQPTQSEDSRPGSSDS